MIEPIEPMLSALRSVSVTELKQHLRHVIDLVISHKAVAIVRHDAPEAVLISPRDYLEYQQLKRERLDLLTERFDALTARMQTPEAAEGVDALFDASGEELGRAAVAAAKRG